LGVGRGVGIAVVMIGLVAVVAAVVWLVAGSFLAYPVNAHDRYM